MVLDLTRWGPAAVALTVVWAALGALMGLTMGSFFPLGLVAMLAFLSLPVLLAVGEAKGHVILSRPKEAT